MGLYDNDEEETEEVSQVEAFMVEEEDPIVKQHYCNTCSSLRVGTRVCGIFKPLQRYELSNGVHNTEDTFWCGRYIEEKE